MLNITQVQPAAVQDFDTGAGVINQVLFGIALPANGGPVAGGTATNPLRVDPTGSTPQPITNAALDANLSTLSRANQLPATLDGGNLRVMVENTSIAVTGPIAVTNAGLSNLDVALSTIATKAQLPATLDTGNLRVMVENGSPIAISGTITVGNATLAVTQSGTWTVQQGTAPWSFTGTKGNNAGVPGTTNLGTLPALANAALPSWVEGNQVALSTDLSGLLRGLAAGTNVNALDKTITANITTIGNTVELDAQGSGSARWTITGIWTGTIVFEQTIDGTNWLPFTGLPTPAISGAALQSSTTVGGAWIGSPVGSKKFRLRASAAITGTAVCTINSGQHVAYLNANIVDDAVYDTTKNGTTATLIGGGVFTGTGADVTAYNAINVFIYSDVPSAAGGVTFQFSTDDVTWVTSFASTYTDTGMCSHTVLHRRARYFRIIYVNGAVNQATFQLQVIYQRVASPMNMVGIEEMVDPIQTGLLTRSVIVGKSTATSGAYVNPAVLDHDNLAGPSTPGLAVRPVLDQYQYSAFLEQKVSVPFALADIVQKYGRDTRLISISTATGGAVADQQSMSGFKLSVTATNGSAARARTNEWYRYQSGRGQQIMLSMIHTDAGQANQTRNWGNFDDNDGLMFRLTGTVLSVVRRTSTGEGGGSIGAPFEQVITQSSWNIDKLNGAGGTANPSGITLDITKGNIYEIRFQWLGVGTVQYYVNTILVHRMVHPNTLAFPYMRTATLPLTWEIVNTGASAISSMYATCGHVTSESGEEPTLSPWSAVGAVTTASAAETPILSIQLKGTVNTVDNRMAVIPRHVGISETGVDGAVGGGGSGNRFLLTMRLNPTLTGATFANTTDASSGVNYDTAATAVATPGTLLARWFVPASSFRDIDLKSYFSLARRILRRDAYTGTSDILTFAVTRITGTNVAANINLAWDEAR